MTWLTVDMVLAHSRILSAPIPDCWPDWISDSDLELPEGNLAAWIEWKCNGLFFYNDTPLPFIDEGDSHLLQHILITKVSIFITLGLKAKESK